MDCYSRWISCRCLARTWFIVYYSKFSVDKNINYWEFKVSTPSDKIDLRSIWLFLTSPLWTYCFDIFTHLLPTWKMHSNLFSDIGLLMFVCNGELKSCPCQSFRPSHFRFRTLNKFSPSKFYEILHYTETQDSLTEFEFGQ